MKCYNHHDRDAFGICLSCGKALCLECMDKSVEKVICNNEDCKAKLIQIENAYTIIKKNTSKQNRKLSALLGIVSIFIGIIFAFTAFFISQNVISMVSALIFALFFLLYGIILVINAKNATAQIK